MGKKRERDEAKPADDVPDRMDEDSSDDEVSCAVSPFHAQALMQAGL